jgi:hypothetical protein
MSARQDPKELLASLATQKVAANIWWRRPSVFLPAMTAPAVHEAIKQRLGWLDAPDAAARQIPELDVLGAGVRHDGFTDIYLLGMGGSSLAAEVLRDATPRGARGPQLTILDTTDEKTIRDVTLRLAPERSLFIVASKSGSTIEVTALERHFWETLLARRGRGTGAHFVAITDPESALEAIAADRQYRRTFLNAPDIGGRYSALSYFGLVPAACLGHDLRALVASGQRMAASCRPDSTENPGLALGAYLSAEAAAGHDKLTLLTSPSLLSFGAWIEQLVAESSGKDGRGMLPIVGEPVGTPDEYGPDRSFVALVAPGDREIAAQVEALEASGRRVLRLEMPVSQLGGEFFRWEFGTAVLGTSLRVNPFDEPNVRDAKVRTAAHLEQRSPSGSFRISPPFERREGFLARVSRAVTARDPGPRYLALLDYLPADPDRAAVIARVRADHRRATREATTHGIGPRYLHSTGQFHKGGPNTGMFLMMSASDTQKTPVPGETYSFSSLKQAQALGDFEALVAAGRDVLHCHFESMPADLGATLTSLIAVLEGR